MLPLRLTPRRQRASASAMHGRTRSTACLIELHTSPSVSATAARIRSAQTRPRRPPLHTRSTRATMTAGTNQRGDASCGMSQSKRPLAHVWFMNRNKPVSNSCRTPIIPGGRNRWKRWASGCRFVSCSFDQTKTGVTGQTIRESGYLRFSSVYRLSSISLSSSWSDGKPTKFRKTSSLA